MVFLLEVSHFASSVHQSTDNFGLSFEHDAKNFSLSFALDAPKILNDLPDDVRSVTYLYSFRKKLKTYPFAKFTYLFVVLCRFQHCTGHITTGSWKGRGNQYIQLVKVLYCKLQTNGKQLPAFPLEAVPGTEPRPQRWEVTTLPPWPPFAKAYPPNLFGFVPVFLCGADPCYASGFPIMDYCFSVLCATFTKILGTDLNT